MNLAESSLSVILVGLAVGSVLLVLYLQTRKNAFLLGLGAIAFLTGGGIAYERAVNTDREAVEAQLDALAAAVENNDLDAVESLIAPQATEIRERARNRLDGLVVEKARVISEPKLEFFPLTTPPSAKISFRGFVRAKQATSGMVVGGSGEFELTFEESTDDWLLVDYEYRNLR